MPKENTVLTIDVGGDNLKMAEFVFPPGGGIVLTKFAFRKFEEQDDDTGAGFREAYLSMLAEKQFTATQVRLSLAGQSSFSRLSKLPPLVGNKSAISRVVEYEARQTVPYSMDEVVWDYQLIRHAWNDSRIETQEDGSTLEISDSHEEYEALFVAVKTDLITHFTDVIVDSGKDVISVEIAPVALFNAAKGAGQCREDECVLLLNIGGRGSNLMIADQNRAFIRSIPIAGDSITHQIAKEFGIGFNEAEELKFRHGFVALGGAYEEPESEVAATISKIARNVMTRLHGEVSRSINVWRAQHGGNAPTRVLLSGGGSTMLYITDFFNEKLRLPVEYLNTFGTIMMDDGIDKEELQGIAPMFQELIGMSLRSVTQCPIDISLVPPSIRNQKELNRRKPYFYLAAVSALVCLAIFSLGVHRRLNFDKARVERVQTHVDKTTAKAKEVNNIYSRMKSAKDSYEAPRDFLVARNRWTDMLAELQSIMPDTMWLTALEGVGAPVEEEEDESSDSSYGRGGYPMAGGNYGGAGGPGGYGGESSEEDSDVLRFTNSPFSAGGSSTGSSRISRNSRNSRNSRGGASMMGNAGPFGGGGPFGGNSYNEMDGNNSTVDSLLNLSAGPDPLTIPEVLGVRMVGYTLVLDHELQEQDLIKKVQNSKYFEVPAGDAEWGIMSYTPNTETMNLTSFEIRLKLKEPIKK